LNSRNPIAPSQTPTSLIARMRNELREFWDAMRNTPQAFLLVWAASRSAAVVGVVLTLIAAALPAAQAWAGKLIIDAIVTATGQGMDITAASRGAAVQPPGGGVSIGASSP